MAFLNQKLFHERSLSRPEPVNLPDRLVILDFLQRKLTCFWLYFGSKILQLFFFELEHLLKLGELGKQSRVVGQVVGQLERPVEQQSIEVAVAGSLSGDFSSFVGVEDYIIVLDDGEKGVGLLADREDLLPPELALRLALKGLELSYRILQQLFTHLMSLSFVLGTSLLNERTHPLRPVLRLYHSQVVQSLNLQACLQVSLRSVVYRVFRHPDTDRSIVKDLFADAQSALNSLCLPLLAITNQAPIQRLLALQNPCCKNELFGSCQTYDSRESLRSTTSGQNCPFSFNQSQSRVFGRNPNVGVQGQLQSSPKSPAVYHRNYREGQMQDLVKSSSYFLDKQIGLVRIELQSLLEIGTCAECALTSTFNNSCSNAIILRNQIQLIFHEIEKILGKCVFFLGVVEQELPNTGQTLILLGLEKFLGKPSYYFQYHMICPITNSPILHPVVSPQGVLFEKEAINRHLKNFDFCPVTKVPLNQQGLVEVKMECESLPKGQHEGGSVIQFLKEQYHSVVLQNFYLQQEIQQVHSETQRVVTLNHAAERVLAGLLDQIKEVQAQRAGLIRAE